MINLLPPEEKQKLKQKKIQKMILFFGSLFFLFFLSSILGLLALNFYLEGEIAIQKAILKDFEEQLNKKENLKLKKEIKKINQEILEVKSFWSQKEVILPHLKKIVELLGPEISLQSLSWQKTTNLFSLQGKAKKRENLVALRESLQKEGFKEINFPLSNWVKPKEIDFFASFKIK